MSLKSRSIVALIPLLGALALFASAGCNNGGTATSGGNDKVIRIYSSLPRTGSAKEQTDTIVNGIRMALEEADYKVGDFTIEYEDKDDATAAAGQWTPERESIIANEAVKDRDVMVYIGTFNSGAAKIAIPGLVASEQTLSCFASNDLSIAANGTVTVTGQAAPTAMMVGNPDRVILVFPN